MRIKRVLAGLSTLVAAVALAACSAGQAADVRLAAGTPAPASSTSASSTSDNTKAEQSSVAPGVPCTITAKACVSLSEKQAWLLNGGKIVYGPVKIMPGKKGSTTPVGTWHVLAKEKLHLSREFNDAPMPNSVFFYNGVAFHEGSLGKYSNGCVHLSAPASLKFFSTLEKGDEVQVIR